jgi:uncharacterized protein (DUF58 family)
MAAAAAVVGIWWLVAHNGGAGWVQFVGDLVFGALLVGVFGPAVALARAKVAVQAAPPDATAGQPVALRVAASVRLRVTPLDPPGPDAFVGPARAGARREDDRDTATVLPGRRGVYREVTWEIASAAPFALQWWRRRVTVVLPQELLVAPRRGPAVGPRSGPDGRGDAVVVVRPRSDGALARGVRPYRPGDARRHVHWRATAHAGALMVKDMEWPAGGPVLVVVDLPADPEQAECVAEQALGTLVGLLGEGGPVLLDTAEPTGRVRAPVRDRRGAGRRLARAVSRPGVIGAAAAAEGSADGAAGTVTVS